MEQTRIIALIQEIRLAEDTPELKELIVDRLYELLHDIQFKEYFKRISLYHLEEALDNQFRLFE